MSLTVENLSFSYGQRPVLHQLSFTAQAGELLAILGPNGVGKTTLFKCVMGQARRYEGRILAELENKGVTQEMIMGYIMEDTKGDIGV